VKPKLSTFAAILGTILALYILSIGPVYNWSFTHPETKGLYTRLYRPLIGLGSSGSFNSIFEWYLRLWEPRHRSPRSPEAAL
jgi:hypothetical protein